MTIWIIIIIILLFLLAATSISKPQSVTEKNLEKNRSFYKKLISDQNEPLRTSLTILLDTYHNNKALKWPDLAQEIGIPETVDCKNKEALNKYWGMHDDEIPQEFFHALMLDITHRFSLQFCPLWHYNRVESLSKFHLIIKEDEQVYEPVRRVEWHEHKTIKKITQKSGSEWKFGSTLNSKVTETIEEIKDFKIQDVGTVYLTNERVIFIGKYKNFNFSNTLTNILSINLFREGIILNFIDGKVILLKFFEHDNTKINDPDHVFITNDGLNHFIRILDRILSKTQKTDLRPES